MHSIALYILQGYKSLEQERLQQSNWKEYLCYNAIGSNENIITYCHPFQYRNVLACTCIIAYSFSSTTWQKFSDTIINTCVTQSCVSMQNVHWNNICFQSKSRKGESNRFWPFWVYNYYFLSVFLFFLDSFKTYPMTNVNTFVIIYW